MRCLYCGKELALFKRLRGGEFCSDAHRQRYQEEYTQLALNRLLQANEAKEKEKEAKGDRPPEPESPALKRREKAIREEVPVSAPVAPAPALTAAQKTAVLEPEARPVPAAQAPQPLVPAASAPLSPAGPPPAVAPEPAVAVQKDEPAPAPMSSFLVEVPVFATADPPAPLDSSEAEIPRIAPALPRLAPFQPDLDAAHLDPAARIALSLFTVTDCPTPPRERGLELREFLRGVPKVEIQVKPAVESGFEPVREAFEVSLDARSPGASPALWHAPEVGLEPHAESEILAGELVRLDFALTDWGESAGEAEPSIELPAMAARVEPAPIEPARHEAAPPAEPRPEPLRFEPVHIDPVFMQSIAATQELVLEPAPAAEAAPAAETPVPQAHVAPSVTKPLPVTLHGLAPVRGKPVQVYTTAAVRGGDVQLPRETGLPLRPIMVLGAAPKPASVEPAPEKVPAKQIPIPERQEPRPEAKPRRSEVRVVQVREQAKPEPARPAASIKLEQPKPAQPKPAAPAPSARPNQPPAPARHEEAKPPAAAAKAAQGEKPAESTKPVKAGQIERPAESPKPVKTAAVIRPPAPQKPAAAAGELDTLGLPQLSFQQKETFWSRLPLVVRLGAIAAVLALAIGGVILTSRGSGSAKPAVAASNEPVMVEEPALAATAGWAQDWFADRPNAKLNRHVDILRGSLTQRDYRLVFEAQIERGALGWVFRAADKSFYVEKIQEITPGRDPMVALVHFAVINGQEQQRTQVPLPIQAHLDTAYKVRMDIVGDRFTTWVQDQQVDQWNDNQLAVGGVGLYYENGESAKLRDTLNVIPLKQK